MILLLCCRETIRRKGAGLAPAVLASPSRRGQHTGGGPSGSPATHPPLPDPPAHLHRQPDRHGPRACTRSGGCQPRPATEPLPDVLVPLAIGPASSQVPLPWAVSAHDPCAFVRQPGGRRAGRPGGWRAQRVGQCAGATVHGHPGMAQQPQQQVRTCPEDFPEICVDRTPLYNAAFTSSQ